MGRIEVTEAELLDALRQSRNNEDGDGLSSSEIAELLGCTQTLAVKKLGVLARAGRLRVGRRSGIRLDGIPCKIPVYKLV